MLKQFTSGGSSGGSSQTQLISLAMAEASKLFDKSGGAASGNKQYAVNGAAMTVMKLLVQSKFSSATGGKDSGGLGGLMGIVRRFHTETTTTTDMLEGFQIHVTINVGSTLIHTLYSLVIDIN